MKIVSSTAVYALLSMLSQSGKGLLPGNASGCFFFPEEILAPILCQHTKDHLLMLHHFIHGLRSERWLELLIALSQKGVFFSCQAVARFVFLG
jgi:hypothetical protein